MFSHVMIGANDIDAAKTFYDATFTAFGAMPACSIPMGGWFTSTMVRCSW